MRKLIHNLVIQFREFFKSMTPVKRASIIASGFAVLVTLFIMVTMMSKTEYGPFVNNVPPDRLPLIVETLRKKGVPFQLRNDGSTIAIPKDLIPATQMSLMAELGTADIGALGFEIFDKQDFGVTSYAQKVNFQRALQGELIRAINTLNAVKKSKVLLAIPAKKTFLEEKDEPTASVILEFHPGKILTDDQIRGVVNLVANAVEGLRPDKVTVVDTHGKVLSNSLSGQLGQTSEFFELQNKFSKLLEGNIESILSKVVGTGKVSVKVSAILNPKNSTTIEEIVDPDKTAIRSTQVEEETLNGARTNPAGIPGARSNLPGAEETGQVGFNQNVKKELKTTNYDVPKTTKNIKELAGSIDRISVAVLVDGAWEIKSGTDGKEERNWVPRTARELEQYEKIVKNTIGFDSSRKDSVTIENIQFKSEDFGEADKFLDELFRKKFLTDLAYWAMLAFLFALIFFVVIRPFMKWITDSFQESVDDMLPKTIEELEELQTVDNSLPGMTGVLPSLNESIDPQKAESELLRERIITLIDQDNEKAVNAFGLWLVRRDS